MTTKDRSPDRTIIDTTEGKQDGKQLHSLIEQLQQSLTERTSQLEAANKDLDVFTYSVSHDLRAPLRAVDGFSKFLLEECGNMLDAECLRMLGLIRINIQKMDQLIIDMLALSNITRSELDFSRIDMTHMAISVLNEMTAPDIAARTEFSVDPLPEAFADRKLITRVWASLISNAIKFSAKEKKSSIRIYGHTEGGFSDYYIEDNGAGFNPEYTHQLFGVFRRLHKSADFEGNGMGLAIVQRIIHRHGGKVSAKGAEGKGATFSFSLPVKNYDREQHS